MTNWLQVLSIYNKTISILNIYTRNYACVIIRNGNFSPIFFKSIMNEVLQSLEANDSYYNRVMKIQQPSSLKKPMFL